MKTAYSSPIVRGLIAACFLLLLPNISFGITYYMCDFEDPAENALWQLNTPKNENAAWTNLWYVGAATSCGGSQSLYISNDGGTTAAYSKASNIMIAWREFSDLEPGEYDLAFDWRNVGDSLRAGIYVAWVPESDWSTMNCGLNDDISTRYWLTDNMLSFDGKTLLYNSSVWSHAVCSLKANEEPHRLVFVYRTSGMAAERNPSACIDNVQIAPNCGTPTDLQVAVNGQYATLTWNTPAEACNIRYAKNGDTASTTISNVKGNKVVLPLEHGVYNVYIQVVCDGQTSVWYSFPVVIVYSSKCFNYLDLQDSQCFYSAETADDWHNNESLLVAGKIDNGFMSDRSRHTIHYMEGEYDARTYNSYDSDGNRVSPLRTIPDGEIASVRIGSWEESAHVARVQYDFTVDTTEASVLMLKYAMVLQSSGHEEKARPRFTLKIVDGATGQELSTCTTADFSSKTKGDGWFYSPVKSLSEEDPRDVCWRDWTTVGLNLTEFNGTQVRIILTVYGCTASVHYGYAYFTLNCTSGHIEGINCGDTPTNEFIAPEGFDYAWYLSSEPDNILSTQRVFPVQYDDDREYMVDVIYKTNDQCRFTLTACAIPRYPVPEATYEVFQQDCRNYIRFRNTSHVRTKNLRTGEIIEHSKYPVEYTVWNFGDLATPSTAWEETIEAPAEGGTFTVSLTASVGLCEETLQIPVLVPKIGKDSIVEKHTLCEGEVFTYMGKTYATDTVAHFFGSNRYGCDSVFTLVLRFVPTAYTELADTILNGTSYEWSVGNLPPMLLTETGTYTQVLPQAGTTCDSVITLHLFVLPPLDAHITSVEHPCLGEQTTFDVAFEAGNGSIHYAEAMLCPGAQASSPAEDTGDAGVSPAVMSSPAQNDPLRMEILYLNNEEHLLTLTLPQDIVPGHYTLTILFYNTELGSSSDSAHIEVRYPSTIIQQRWGDVLGIRNENYNGGYVFSAYQWYKNGAPIPDAVYPYYYEEGGLDTDADYHVRLLREGESSAINTCSYQPQPFVPTAPATPSAPRKYLHNGQFLIELQGNTYNLLGIKEFGIRN